MARNVVILAGAYYLSILIGMPFFIAFGHVFAGRAYSGDLATLMNALLWSVPLVFNAVVAGVLAGWMVVTPRPKAWAVIFAALLFLATLSGNHWVMPPSVVDLAGQLIQAIIPSVAGALSFMLAALRIRKTHATA